MRAVHAEDRLHRLGGVKSTLGHQSARATGLYDRRDDHLSLDVIERILV
jgi:hypothetical protein